MNNTRWRTGNDPEQDNEAVGYDASIINDQPSMTKQDKTDDANINIILERFGVTDGSLPPIAFNWTDLDLSDAPTSFSDAMQQIQGATERFNKLPAAIRNDFNHDPANLIAWLSNPANHDEAVKRGYLKRLEEAPAQPAAAPPADEPAA